MGVALKSGLRLPVSPDAVLEAQYFLRQLPLGAKMPDVLPEPDGDIGLEWVDDHARTLVIGFSGTSEITFAALLGGGEKKHGTARFVGSIPPSIRTLVQSFPRRTSKTRTN